MPRAETAAGSAPLNSIRYAASHPVNTPEIISLIASVVSVIIGGFAIWLSVTFYKMSTSSSESIRGAADKIGTSVERLESVFDKLYSDTFSMMKDTVTDMRQQLWPQGEPNSQIEDRIKQESDQRFQALRNDVRTRLDTLLNQQSETDHRISSISDSIQDIVDNAVVASREIGEDVRDQALTKAVVSRFREMKEDIVREADFLAPLFGAFTTSDLSDELYRLRRLGAISFEGKALMDPSNEITVLDLSRARKAA